MLTDDQIKTMVDRFLAWKLPADFAPDAGIKFDPVFNKGTPYEMRHEPTGTNLFHAQQAEAMVRHMVEGIAAPQPEAAPQAQPSDAKQAVMDWMGENDVVLKDRAFKQLCALLSRYGAAPQGGEPMAYLVEWPDGRKSLRFPGELTQTKRVYAEKYHGKIRPLIEGVTQPAGRDAREVPILAADHKGIRVDYSGLLMGAANSLVLGHKETGLAEMLRQLQGHLAELGLRWYEGDTAVVDELLQLYCVSPETRAFLATKEGA